MTATIALPVLVLAAGLVAPGSAAAQPDRAGAPQPPPRAASVVLQLPPGLDPARFRPLVAIAEGDPVSSQALRRTVELLFETGRFQNVVVRELPGRAPAGQQGTWVALVVECEPLRTVGSLVFLHGSGPAPDAERLAAASGLKRGDPLDPAALEAAVARIRADYAKRGYRAAEVEAQVEGGTEVDLKLLVRPGPLTRVARVRFAGDGGGDPGALLAPLRTRPGAVLDDDALAADVRDLRARLWDQGYRRARVGAPVVRDGPEGAEVEIPLDAGPRLVFVVRGSAEIPAPELVRQLGFEKGQPVDAPSVDAATDRLLAYYRARGYATARVWPEEVRRGAIVIILFHVEEGRRYRIRRVRIDGARSHGEDQFREQLLALLDEEGGGAPEPPEADRARLLALSVPDVRVPPSTPPPVPPRERWDDAAWDRAGQRMVDGYRAEGWLEAVFLGATVSLDATLGTADVTVRLREGVRTTVESISFEGNQVVSAPELAREARLAPNDPLSFERVEATRMALLRLYLARGHVYARVEARLDVDRERHVAAVRCVIEEGPRVRLGHIVLTGTRRTREEVVRRALAVAEGDVYDPEAIVRSQWALLRLGVFRSVGLRLRDPEVPKETKDLSVELSERPWQTISQSLGYSIANGPRAMVEYEQPNLAGRALDLVARAKVNYPVETPFSVPRPDLAGKPPPERIEGRAEVGIRQPRPEAMPLPVGYHVDLVGERLLRRAYHLGRGSAITGLDLGVTDRVSFSLQYELEVDRLDRPKSFAGILTQADLELLRFDEGITTLQSLRPTFTLDFRDNSVHPHRGWFASGTLEYAHSIDGDIWVLPRSQVHTNMVRVWGTLSGYLPFGRSTVLALSLRGGRVFALDPDSRTIGPKRFFLGGANTMRGFAEDEMIQEDVRPLLDAEARHCASSLTGIGCTANGQALASGKIPVSEGGTLFLLGKAEIRMSLGGSLEAAIFVDLGNLWLLPENFRLTDLRPNLGTGVRFVTPIGPVAFDVGFNPVADRLINERIYALHFTVGLF